MPTSSYLFVFGRTPDLSWQELVTLFPSATRVAGGVGRAGVKQIQSILSKRLSCEVLEDEIPDILEGLLAGCIKVVKLLDIVEAVSQEYIVKMLHDELPVEEKHPTFGISMYGRSGSPLPKIDLSQVKSDLKDIGITADYVVARHEDTLSSVVIKKKHVIELVFIDTEKGMLVGKTVSVQQFDSWSMRDYDRPQADARSGMLPPKVARMIVNIAEPEYPYVGKTILDPFCGMGTILAEALMVGWDIVGSDVDSEVLEKAKQNIAWLKKQYEPLGSREEQWFTQDATHIDDHIQPGTIDAVVTEPYLGPTKLGDSRKSDRFSDEKVANIAKGLEKLYVGCVKCWYPLLKNGGKLVIAIPTFTLRGREIRVKKVIDTCEILGYTTLVGPIAYSRPQAVVQRDFYVLQKSVKS
jgi:tRNA G10  N-methylase Trm11